MPSLDDYTQQSPYSDSREYAPLITALPADLPSLAAAVRNVLVHYRVWGPLIPGTTRGDRQPMDRSGARRRPQSVRHPA
jgi:hypothetical protein